MTCEIQRVFLKFLDDCGIRMVKLMQGTANTSLTIGKLKGVEITYPTDPEAQQNLIDAFDRVLGDVAELDSFISSARADCSSIIDDSLSACFEVMDSKNEPLA